MILSEIESFNSIFLKVVNRLIDFDVVKLMSSVLLSPGTREFFLQMNVEQMPELKYLALNEDFRKYRHITLHENIMLCPLKEEHKQSSDDFEFVLAVYSKRQLSGLVYCSIDPKHQDSIVSGLMDETLMMLFDHTVVMLCDKYAAYNRLFYTVNNYLEILSVKEHNMPFHTTNVANLCLKLARKTKLSVTDTMKLYIAALLHDTGKLYIPDEILNNKKKYTYHEYEAIKKHAEKSAEIARSDLVNLPHLQDVPKIIRCHHERMDGSGYPDGLVGDEIPLLSRYLMIADSVDAMLTPRDYKKQMSRNAVVKELQDCSGSQFDDGLVRQMILVLKESRNRYDIASVVGTNYIHRVALTYFYENIEQIITINGALVMQRDKGKFIMNKPFSHDISKMDGVKLCFYYLNDIYEYNVNVNRLVGNQLILDHFRFEPLEEQFSIPWRLKTSLYYNRGTRWDAEIIKIGSSSLVFEVSKKHKDNILEKKKLTLNIPVHMKMDEFDEFVEIEAKLMQYFEFDDKLVMYSRYIGVKDSGKDKLIRALFKKQIVDRKAL